MADHFGQGALEPESDGDDKTRRLDDETRCIWARGLKSAVAERQQQTRGAGKREVRNPVLAARVFGITELSPCAIKEEKTVTHPDNLWGAASHDSDSQNDDRWEERERQCLPLH